MSKTFKDLTLKEAEKYWKALIEREERRKEAVKDRFYKAWNLAKEISKILYEKYQAKEVIVFGSLIDISLFKEWSDIDIAVLGIPNSLYFKAVAEVISLDEEFEIDLVDIESCSENLKKVIREKGIRL